MLTMLLRNYIDAVLGGGVAATLPQVEVVAPIALPKPAPVTQVCAFKAVAWIDAAGIVQTAARGTDIELSPQTAKRGIELNAVCTMSDPRRRIAKERLGTVIGKPLRRNCVELSDNMPPDNEREPFAPEPVMRSAPPASIDPLFTPLPVGPPRQALVEGARNLDDVARHNSREAKT
jgi:hypothetical protein